ncbi:non-specific lipid transfer protein GPI-anchored 2-like [Cucumis melo var. makuwa]|uniref:Non-specific lipid transfer protein GPI-anchored 2-like n=1 Tax=Cucumis melo var. makuwa TaxID=1194695 RepID=A0A5A7UN75_CUCMM|nr:non-specific lipid transfer protein GPI-anchored 2-like [Cucumis melo var. makuwa]
MTMEILKALAYITVAATILGSFSVEGQTPYPCTTSMMNNFTPCFNAITGSSSNGSSQQESCCTSLRSLSGTSMDCACLLLTANVPVPLPINAALGLILPSSCNISNLPAQCKERIQILILLYLTGPISLGPTAPTPTAATSPELSPRVSKAVAVAPAPQQLTTTNPPAESVAPAATHRRIRPVLTPSASVPTCFHPPSLLLISIAIMVFKSH